MATKTVTIEPTKEMLVAGQAALDDCVDEDYESNVDGDYCSYTTIRSDAAARIWRAMFEAAE